MTRLDKALALIATALLVTNAYLSLTPVDLSPIAGDTAQPLPERFDTSLAELPPRGDVSQTNARPMFAANRRPPAPRLADQQAQPAPTMAAADDTHLELRGVMRRGGRMQALIRSQSQSVGTWVPVGSSHDGLRVRAIKGDTAVVEANGRSYELTIRYRRSAADAASEPAQGN